MNTNIRFEFKYVIDKQQARQIEAYIDKIGLEKDGPGHGQYTVCSLYFDTPDLKDYYEKQAGLKRRRKLRARIYNADFNHESLKIWLEAKEKHDMFVHKIRQTVSHDDWLKFSNNGTRFDMNRLPRKEEDLNYFSYHFLSGNYKPQVVVSYKRKAYVGNFFAPFRLTLDSDIKACKWRDFRYNRNMVSVKNNSVILEVKFFTAMPWWFQDMVDRFGLKRQAFSKYMNAVDAISKFNKIAR